MSKYNNYKEISKGVSDFLKESEGVFTLEYISKDGDKLTTDTINGQGEALTFMTSLADTYREFGTENAYALELTDGEGNVIANAEYPEWEVVEVSKLQEDDATIDTAEGYIWNDFLSDGEADDYESFSYYTMDISKADYKKAVKNVEKVYNNIADHIYNSEGKDYLELHDHHTLYQLTNEERNPEDWGYFVQTAIESFEENTGVELWQAGRMGRHMVVELNYENAKRYDELVAVCEEMEQIAIDEFNKKEENIEEAEAVANEKLEKIIADFKEAKRDTDSFVKALNTVSKMEWENEITKEEYDEAINEIKSIYNGKSRNLNESEVANIDWILDRHSDLDITNREMIGSDYSYHTLLKSVNDAERFNYHSDYWGSADEYQDAAIDVVADFEEHIGNEVEYTTEEEGTVRVKVEGVLIDKQYNSHLKLLVEFLNDGGDDAGEKIEESVTDTLIGKEFKCTKGMSHPNMGRMFTKGKVYTLSEEGEENITLGGWNIHKHYLDTHFEEVPSKDEKLEEAAKIETIDVENTGGYVMVGYGKLSDGRYFAISTDLIILYNNDPRENEDEQGVEFYNFDTPEYAEFAKQCAAVENGTDMFINESESLNEEILSEPIKDAVRNTIEKINDLLRTVKHVVEMDTMSINSMIETINDKTTLNIEEIELDDLYKAIANVKEDLEYALKNSDWSEEEAAEMDESEKLTESEEDEREPLSNIPEVEKNDTIKELRDPSNSVKYKQSIIDSFRENYNFNFNSEFLDFLGVTEAEFLNLIDDEDDEDEELEFTMVNTNNDKRVSVKKVDGKWIDSDGNRYMGYLSKQDVKSYFKGGNWIEEAEHTKQTAKEIVSEILGRAISPRAKKISVGYKWWDWAMQENFVALAEYFGLYNKALKDAISKTDPFENTSNEDLVAAEEVVKNATVEIATKLKEHLDSKGATDYKISRVGQYTGQSRMVTFTFYSFKITFLPQTNLKESANLQDASDDQLKDLCKQEISTGKLTARKLRKVEGINDIIAELKKSGKLQGDEINNNGKYARLTGKGYAKVIDTLSSEQIRDLCMELGYAPNLTESKQVEDLEKLKELFLDIAAQYEEAEEITDSLRSLNSEGELSDEGYDIIQNNWDEWLKDLQLDESESKSLKDAFENVGSFEELKDTIENLAEEYGDFYDEWLDIADDYEKKCIKYIKKLSKVTTVDPKDEYGYESDYVSSAIKAICGTESLDEKDNSK